MRKFIRFCFRIHGSVNVVFLKQLTHWILYAKMVDAYGEFFIQSSEYRINSTLESEKGTSMGSGKNTVASISVSLNIFKANCIFITI